MIDLSRPHFLSLYAPRPSDPAAATIRHVLKQLNVSLGTVVRCAPRPHLREDAVTSILRACVHCVETLLLRGEADGLRHAWWAEPADVEIVRSDLALLRDFFLARDAAGVAQGVPQYVVDEISAPAAALLELAASPSDAIVDEWARAADAEADAEPAAAAEAGRYRLRLAQLLTGRSDAASRAWAAKHGRAEHGGGKHGRLASLLGRGA